jgi:hypothetical protein
MRRSVAALGLASVIACSCPAHAVEGGTGAYLLGSRDSFAGIVPGPGTYVTNNFVFMSGKGPTLSLGGVPVTSPEVDVYINKLDIAHFFESEVLGGTPGLVLSIPYGIGDVTGDFLQPAPFDGFRDDNNGFGDIVITPLIGWHDGNFHYSAGVSIFVPVGKYSTASVSAAPPSVDDILNFGKNRWAFMPTFNATYFDRTTGLEVSGSLGITFSTVNTATDWQTAPELSFEAAILQHFPNGLAFGVSGYAYQQIGEDSGSGADNFRTLLGAESLKARVFGIGPIATYNTKFGETPIGFKLKYTHEFEAKRRFESNIVWGSVNFSF